MDNYLPREVHDEFAKRMEDEHERQNHRIGNLEKDVAGFLKLAGSIDSLAKSTDSMAKELQKQGERLDAIEKKPSERWDNLIDKIVWAVAAAVIAFLLAQIGL